MKTAVVVIDMVKDNLELCAHPQVAARARAIVEPINRLTRAARQRGWPVIFSTDSFLPGDFIFSGKMKPHSIRGSEGAEISELLVREPQDLWVPKRRMSAFFKTDLDMTLRLWEVKRIAVCGVMTPYCVLTTALDAVCLDFRAVIVEDATNALSDEDHQRCLGLYRRSPLRPLLEVKKVEELLGEE